jgi:hypothetical protein
MATRCARDVGEFTRVMTGFCMFYRLLTYEARAASAMSHVPGDNQKLSLLPRVSAQTRAQIVRRIDSLGSQGFTADIFPDPWQGDVVCELVAGRDIEDVRAVAS